MKNNSLALAALMLSISPMVSIVAAQTSSTSTAESATTTVARAGGVLNPSAAAEANPVDNTAVRAFSGRPILSSSGGCLTIDPTAGDFRENLIPITIAPCNGEPGQNFDVVTSGKHNDVPGTALVVSSLTQGCLNFDPRRAAGDTVIMFSCGGRADGGGSVTDSQLFPFTQGSDDIELAPGNAQGAICLVVNGDKLDSAPCTKGPEQVFTIG